MPNPTPDSDRESLYRELHAAYEARDAARVALDEAALRLRRVVVALNMKTEELAAELHIANGTAYDLNAAAQKLLTGDTSTLPRRGRNKRKPPTVANGVPFYAEVDVTEEADSPKLVGATF